MRKETFLQQVDTYGIPLNKIGVIVDQHLGVPHAINVYQREDEWVVCEHKERGGEAVRYAGDEETAFDWVWKEVMFRLTLDGYVTAATPKELICTGKDVVFDFLREKFSMNDRELQQTWDYLKQDFHVLNEVKYFAVNGKFVPDEYCYRVQGYTAKRLFDTTYLDPIGAYNYLVYLKRRPKEALADLKAGLPRK